MTADAEHPNLASQRSGDAPVQTAPGGRLLATYDAPGQASPGYHYNLTDWLGTKRMQTTSGGNQQETCISNPFGDGLSCTGGTDATEQHFTGKDRDVESGLDYFYARYYSSILGRFMTPDWAGKPTAVPYASFGDPQSLNLYAYVGNNPNTGIDVDGHMGQPPAWTDVTDNGIGQVSSTYNMPPIIQNQEYIDSYWEGQIASGALSAPPTPQGDSGSAQQQNQDGSAKSDSSTAAATPECFAHLKTRPVDDIKAELAGGTHSFWYVQGSDGVRHTLSGEPDDG
jgi:RHS repeat-associated protein